MQGWKVGRGQGQGRLILGNAERSRKIWRRKRYTVLFLHDRELFCTILDSLVLIPLDVHPIKITI